MIVLIAMALLTGQDAGDPPVDCANAMTTYEVNSCAGQDVAAEEARMRTYLSAAVTRLRHDAETPEQAQTGVEALEASQGAWETYADGACRAVSTFWQGGTIRTVMAVSCKEELTQERTLFLWREYLTYVDSTPALLPRPSPLKPRPEPDANDLPADLSAS